MANRADYQGKTVRTGDTVRLSLKLIEGGKERIQIFEGMILGIKGRGDQRTIRVGKRAVSGVWVERVIPLFSPWLAKVEVKRPGKSLKRAKLYWMSG